MRCTIVVELLSLLLNFNLFGSQGTVADIDVMPDRETRKNSTPVPVTVSNRTRDFFIDIPPTQLPPDMPPDQMPPAANNPNRLKTPANTKPSTVDLFDISVTVCGSCQDRCEVTGRIIDSSQRCMCDEVCVLLGDCCLDYELECVLGEKRPRNVNKKSSRNTYRNRNSGVGSEVMNPAKPIENEDRQEPSLQQWQSTHIRQIEQALLNRTKNVIRDTMKCINIYSKIHPEGFRQFHMISHCPNKSASTLYNAYCETDERVLATDRDLDISMIMPVLYKKSLLYRNKYCAMCHGKNESVEIVSPEFDCPNTSLSDEAKRVLQTKGYDQFLKYIRHNCYVVFDISHIPNRLRCASEAENNSCVASIKSGAGVCQTYFSPVLIDNKSFRNGHCARCMGNYSSEYILKNSSCYFPMVTDPAGKEEGGSAGSIISELPSFSIMLDFQGHHSKRVFFRGKETCGLGEVYDIISDKCQTLLCPPGQIFTNNSCSVISFNIPQPLAEYNFDSVYVDARIEAVTLKALNIATVFTNIAEQLTAFHFHNISRNSDCEATGGRIKVITCNITAMKVISIAFRDQVLEVRDVFVTRIIPNIENNLPVSVLSSLIAVRNFPEHLNISCSSGILKERSVILRQFAANSQTTLHANETGLAYNISDVAVTATLTYHGSEFISYTAYVCEALILQCSRYLLSRAHFNWTVDGLVHLFQSGSILMPSEYMNYSDDQVLICADMLNKSLTAYTEEDTNDISSLITLIGNCLSVGCLILTLITYALFQSLRTVAGKAIMNLCVALSLAQVAFQVSFLFSTWGIVCLGIGILTSYMWLSAFCWMNILAFDVSSTFANMDAAGDAHRQGRFRYYLVYGWGMPLLIKIVGVGLHFGDILEVYDNTRCYLKAAATLYFALIPIALALLVNVFLFSRAVWFIYHAIKIASKVKDTKNQNRDQLIVYFKLASIMGFSWVFGILDAFLGSKILMYCYIVLNTLQGVFIFVSFVCKKRVFRMYQRKLGYTDTTMISTGTNTGTSKLSTSNSQSDNADK